MQLEQKNKMNMVAYLRSWNNYSASYLAALPDIQLYAIYLRIKQGREALISEILALQRQSSLAECFYTKESLHTLGKDELLKIKNTFLSKDKEEESFFSEEKFSASFVDTEYEYLEPSEIDQMYGESAPDYSPDELRSKGIYLTQSYNSSKLTDRDTLKEQLVIFLVKAHQRGLIYFPYSEKKMRNFSLDYLKLIYTSRVAKLQNEDFPPLEEIEMKLSLY